MGATTEELELIRQRGEAPLVRLKRAFSGYPAGTLGYIVGVERGFIQVQLATGQRPSLLHPFETENVA